MQEVDDLADVSRSTNKIIQPLGPGLARCKVGVDRVNWSGAESEHLFRYEL
jgi:hypothetical protein